MIVARSKFMFTIFNEDTKMYLHRRGRGWTSDKWQARWYAYWKYAYEKISKLREVDGGNYRLVEAYRNEEVCKAGGQHHK